MPRYATARYVAPRRRPVYKTSLLKAPVGGLNARDSIADMPIEDAIRMTNMWCTTLDVVLRNGYSQWATGLGAEVESIAPYNKPDGTGQIFAAAGGDIFDVTASGAVGAAEVSGQNSAQWQHTQFATTGGTFLYLVNGVDDPQLYDGTTWTAINGASSPAITGVTTSEFINVNVFKTRLWFIQKDTLLAWYLPSGSIAGAATSFDFRPVFKKGGYLVAMGTWTIDGGDGIDDYAVFVTSEGEIAVYKGTDPASADTFALVGVFQVANPIGYRCLDKLGGDLILINRDGLLPLSKALLTNRSNTRFALTDKINSALSQLTSQFGNTFGWETCLFPQENMLILNVPVTTGEYQFAMNTITKSWSLFKGWNANCFERSGEKVYFGGDGYVAKIWDDMSDDGDIIRGESLQAFSRFGTSQQKYFKMTKPLIATNGLPAVLLSMYVDYDLRIAPTSTATFSASNFGLWDSGIWDDAIWGGDAEIKQEWQTLGAIGTAAALDIQVAAMGIEFKWEATQYVYEEAQGTVL